MVEIFFIMVTCDITRSSLFRRTLHHVATVTAMPKDITPRFTTTYKPPTGRARAFGFGPIRSIRRSRIDGARLDCRFTGPVEKITEPISEGDTTQWDIDHGFVDPPPNYHWIDHEEPSKTRHGEDEAPAPLRPVRSFSLDERRRKVIRFVTGPVERIEVRHMCVLLSFY
jgi:hypothetical protein